MDLGKDSSPLLAGAVKLIMVPVSVGILCRKPGELVLAEVILTVITKAHLIMDCKAALWDFNVLPFHKYGPKKRNAASNRQRARGASAR
jgi:hypothetical protein